MVEVLHVRANKRVQLELISDTRPGNLVRQRIVVRLGFFENFLDEVLLRLAGQFHEAEIFFLLTQAPVGEHIVNFRL